MKKFFEKIVVFLHALFGGNLDSWITDHVEPAISFVEKLKAFLESPVADIITALIPGEIDDKLKDFFLANVSKALDILQVTEAINQATSIEDKLKLLTEYLLTLSPNMRNAVYMKLASQIAKVTGNTDSIKGYSVDLLVQSQYSKIKALADGSVTADTTDNSDTSAPAPVVEAAPAPAVVAEFNREKNEFHTV